MARDRFDREIDYLRISVTDRCNYGCIYCMPGKEKRLFSPLEILGADEIVRVVAVSKKFGVRKVRVTGGEPLLRGDILEIISRIKDLGVKDLSLTTNGALLANMAEALKAAGLDRVNVSLDTMDPVKFRKITSGGEMAPILEGIEAARKAGLSPVKINMVPIRGINDDEIKNFARLTFKDSVHIRFIEFMPSGRKGIWDESKLIRSSEIKEMVKELGPLRKLQFKGKGPSRNYRFEGAEGMIGFISPVSHNFCYCCNRLRINAIGKIRPCLFSSTEVDIATPMRRGACDEELERLFALAVEVKPAGNYLRNPSKVNLESMSSIGG